MAALPHCLPYDSSGGGCRGLANLCLRPAHIQGSPIAAARIVPYMFRIMAQALPNGWRQSVTVPTLLLVLPDGRQGAGPGG